MERMRETVFKNPLLVVRDLAVSTEFYRRVLGLETVQDFGANVILDGGISLQTQDSWLSFLDREEIRYGGNAAELYFEADDYDDFLRTLQSSGAELVHPPMEHRWGQRVVRFYDPDRHILEVGEPIRAVCRRFRNGGLSSEGIARRMELPVSYVEQCLR